MQEIRSRSVSLTDFLELGKGATRLHTFEEARQFYVDYHVLLSEVGIYSCAGILLSASRALLTTSSTSPRTVGSQLVFVDGASASGLRTVADLGLEPLVDVRPQAFLAQLRPHARWRIAARLAGAVPTPTRFFTLLFDAYVEATLTVLDSNPGCRGVIVANERSLGCAPSLAAARFLRQLHATVVQHGNPVADYLPTIADEYWCRSDRWFKYLKDQAVVPEVRRIRDFPVLDGIQFAPDSRRAILVMHNVGYLEPDLDYQELSERIKSVCNRAGWTLHAMRHPANKESYGLPVVDRHTEFKASVGIGFRSTATDQLPDGMRRISLLDYWPDFFLRDGCQRQLDDFLLRIEEALV